MEIVLGVGIVLGAILGLCLLAYVVRRGTVFVAQLRGYTAETMPILFHLIGFGTYFSVIMLIHAVYITLLTT